VRALTIAAIAKTAEMSEANIYRHFGGKEDIYFALADFIGVTVMGQAQPSRRGAGGPSKSLRPSSFPT